MKKLNSPIQATPVNRATGSVKQDSKVTASIVGCIDGPLGTKVCAPFANKKAK